MRRIYGGLRELSGGWLGRFFEAMHTDARRTAAGAYLTGLLDANPRKSLRAIADRTEHVAYHQMHHFMNSCAVKDGPLRDKLLQYARDRFARFPAYLVTEDIVIPKRGTQSAGVAFQSINADSEAINCQIIVSIMIVRGSHVVPIAMHLIDTQKLAAARKTFDTSGPGWHAALSSEKTEIILKEMRRLKRSGIRLAGVIADSSIWNNIKIRRYVADRKLDWIVRIPFGQKFRLDRRLDIRNTSSGVISDGEICGSEMLASSKNWATPHMHFAACTNWPSMAGCELVRLGAASHWSDGSGADQLVQLVVEVYPRGEKECYISDMNITRKVHNVVEIMQSYWFCRKAHMQMLSEFGLAKFEGRSRIGLSRHLLMASIAYLYSNHLQLDKSKNDIN